MSYVDGFLIVVPKKRLADYVRMAKKAGKVWMEHGAVAYMETVGDDLDIQNVATFSKLLKLKPTQTAVFSWIVYKNKAQRDKINAKIMQDERILSMMKTKDPPFDMKRMVYGGFEAVVEY